MPSEFTVDQARDLARHFLGTDWKAAEVHGLRYLIRGPGQSVHTGSSWREAFRSARINLPMRPRYTAQGPRVMMEDRAICTAVTNTMAKRIAGALNEYVPDRRGI